MLTRGGKVKEAEDHLLLIQKKMRNIRGRGIRKQFRSRKKRTNDFLQKERRIENKKIWEDRINELCSQNLNGNFTN